MSNSSVSHPLESSPATSLPILTSTSAAVTAESSTVIDVSSILNINVGILGHVDSGKTSLVKAMSTLLSTASLDKSKQSRERGMTLDLGFSCFFVDTVPLHLLTRYPNKKQLQITLVDCPGHASLIRTIIGGAQIIDIVLLVVDAVKGWQAQTTECLVLAELCTSQIVIALNKIDSIPIMERETKLNQVRKQIQQVHLQRTRFANLSTTIPMIGVSACIGGEKVAAIVSTNGTTKQLQDMNNNSIDTIAVSTTNNNNENVVSNGPSNSAAHVKNETMNVDLLISTLIEHIPIPQRVHHISTNNSKNKDATAAFYFAIDHCFPMRGRGTVITGTCLSGSIAINDTIEFPTVSVERKIKSMQMFKRSVTTISQGDRAGICVSHFDATTIERSIAASPPGTIQLWKGAIAIVKKVSYYPNKLLCNSKFHISVGHTTVMATVSFWGGRELASLFETNDGQLLDGTLSSTDNIVLDNLKCSKPNKTPSIASSFGGSADMAGLPRLTYDYNEDYVYQDGLLESLDENENNESSTNAADADSSSSNSRNQLLNWALLEFQTPVHCPMNCLVIGSRLDTVDNATKSASSCRLAFSGRLLERIDPVNDAQRIRLYNKKEKQAIISKLGDPYKRTDDEKTVRYEVFGSDLFKKETNMKIFIGMKLVTQAGEVGEIKSSFGTDGNFRVHFPAGTEAKVGDPLILLYKRYLHDVTKAMHQDLELPSARSGSRIEVVKKKSKKNEPGVNKFGLVDSVKGDVLKNGKHNMAIVSGLFAPEINIKERVGAVVVVPGTGEAGAIVGPFGKAGKCKVVFENGISANIGDKAELRT